MVPSILPKILYQTESKLFCINILIVFLGFSAKSSICSRSWGQRFLVLLFCKIFFTLLLEICTVQSRFSDTLFSDKSRFSDNFAEDHFFST